MLQSMLLQRVGPDLATEQQQRNILYHSWCFLNTAFSWFFLSAQWSLFCLLRALLPKYLVLKFPMAHSSVLFPSLLHTHWDRAILSRFRSWTFEFQIYIPRPIETWISNCPFHISTWMSDISNAACPQWNFWCLLLLFGCWVMSDCLQPHGLQPTRVLCPWDFPGNTGVGGPQSTQLLRKRGWKCLISSTPRYYSRGPKSLVPKYFTLSHTLTSSDLWSLGQELAVFSLLKAPRMGGLWQRSEMLSPHTEMARGTAYKWTGAALS